MLAHQDSLILDGVREVAVAAETKDEPLVTSGPRK